MLKKFSITRNAGGQAEGVTAPGLDKYQRMEQLNDMLRLGWVIKEFRQADGDSYFLLEKAI